MKKITLLLVFICLSSGRIIFPQEITQYPFGGIDYLYSITGGTDRTLFDNKQNFESIERVSLAPTVTTIEATDITTTTATLNGEITSTDVIITSAYFNIGEDPNKLEEFISVEATLTLGTGIGNFYVNISPGYLIPDKVYYFIAAVETDDNRTYFGDFLSFTTSAVTISVEEFTETRIVVCPNPAEAVIHICSLENNADYILYDIQGNILKRGTLIPSIEVPSIVISQLSKGMYFLSIKTSKGHFVKKVMKR